MSSFLPADRSEQPLDSGHLDALITQAHRLRGGLERMRQRISAQPQDAPDAEDRWRRALTELAVQQVESLGGHLHRLRHDDQPSVPLPGPSTEWPAPTAPPSEPGADRTRVGSAEWNLLTDEVEWSPELFALLGRDPRDGPLSLDELPSFVLVEDQPLLTRAVTGCLVDGRPVDMEFRVWHTDGDVRHVHMTAEPLMDQDGTVAAMWALLRDVSELRNSERALSESDESLRRERHLADGERRLAVEMQEAVLPPWRGPVHTSGPAVLDLAGHYLPSATAELIGGDWYDALELPDGRSLLTVGALTGHGVVATSGMAMLLGAIRGMAVAGVDPGPLMGHLNELLDSASQPAMGTGMCCRFDPEERTLTWAQAGHPPPLLFREGVGRPLESPEGVLLGVTVGNEYAQHTERLRTGDVLVLHTEGLSPRSGSWDGTLTGQDGDRPDEVRRLLALAPRFARARTARECARAVVEEFEDGEREDDACVLVARVGNG
ncbi:SpoIIE family protein phosphatase [Streptomyces sp. NPDC005438]|uniref:PP2C family protein-serine/threonine phosphatase n=1 Tax=Streptomyces sp. NPDC005438 TaxID=3156880 RepID=UPI0033AD9C30